MQDFVVKELQKIEGVQMTEPQGAFYCLPVMSSFFGPDAAAEGFGAIPDADALCRYAPQHVVDSAFPLTKQDRFSSMLCPQTRCRCFSTAYYLLLQLSAASLVPC